MYQFDTDTISALLKRDPPSRLVRRLAEVPPDQQQTSTITVGELVYGAYRSSRPAYFLERLEGVTGNVSHFAAVPGLVVENWL
ncbi:MAG: hypothetical protein HY355_03080 [Armatimonadetes bacterium]|nr:hypothetical protein [Armatimonadota bacterium]